jgi:hypothetical protein
MIEVRGLTKRYGPTVAVDGLGFEVRPGAVTGFLGPAKYFPTMIAGNSLAVSKPVADVLSPWVGFGVLCVYVLAALGAGGRLLTRRDA